MCTQHLLGEHLEMHMFVGAFHKGKKLTGYLQRNLVALDKVQRRHDDLAREITGRGYRHKSPINHHLKMPVTGHVDIKVNIKELMKRCSKCRQLLTTQH